MMNIILILCTKDCLTVLNESQESLNLKKNDNSLNTINDKFDNKSKRSLDKIRNNLFIQKIESMSTLKCLSIITKFTNQNINLIKIESKRSILRIKTEFEIVADKIKSDFKRKQFKEEFLKTNSMEQSSITKITRGCLHH